MKRIVSLSSWKEVTERIGRDLSWYSVYSSMMRTFDILDADPCKAETLLGNEIYLAAVRSGLEALLSEHVFAGKRVRLNGGVVLEALEFYDQYMPDVPTFEISGYLNYLDSWSDAKPDWQHERPCAFDNLEIAFTFG